ncbi:hypothetical protein Amet_0816 [Alkaliphilus metalliredigens QYMF]|uniref:Uncharacterized protein n=1 Tax=Alkaliphilus metalliredigens (strain QYMF) TaxID=293826 RepID=A6TLH3_ALKMQ|nr:hypothetical protein [Alkaliphilus metalliredigens]ABR47041.1 hypothetical protein Amet_0816 [Alkaliphilus metalliredigens QYMF]
MLILLYLLLIVIIIVLIPFVYRISVLIGQRIGKLAIEYHEDKDKFQHLKKKDKKSTKDKKNIKEE